MPAPEPDGKTTHTPEPDSKTTHTPTPATTNRC
jgi:hypothetical protein